MLSLKKTYDAGTLRRLFCLSAAALVLAVALARYAFVYYSLLLFSLALTPLSCMAAGVTLFERDATGQREFRLLLAFFLWTLVCAVLNERRGESLLNNQADLSSLAITVFLCFPLAALLRPALFQKFLRHAAASTVLTVSALDALGIFAALTGRYRMFPFNSQYGVGIEPAYGRLFVLCHPNTVGMIAIVGVGLGFYLIRSAKRRAWKGLYALCILMMYLAAALANARTSCFAIALCFGLIALQSFVACRRIAQKLWRVAGGVAALLLVTAALFAGTRLVVRGYNALRAQSAVQAPAQVTAAPQDAPGQTSVPSEPAPAQADPAPAVIIDRSDASGVRRLNGRLDIWQAALSEALGDPSILLFGVSPGLVADAMEKYEASSGNNLHNAFLQVLFSTGCVGLLLFFALLVSLFLRCLRLFFAPGPDRRAESCLPILLAGVLALSMMESFLLLYPDVYLANVWFFLLAGYICLLDGERTNSAA